MSNSMRQTWDLWLDECPHSPAWNMAADEAALVTASRRDCPLLRFYRWNVKAVSIGYVQTQAAAPEGFAVVRRPTGGGVVYHDYDFTFSVTFPKRHPINGMNRVESYDVLNTAVQNALQKLGLDAHLTQCTIPHSVDRMTMVCFTNPTRYDIMLNGRKVGGAAQRRTRDGLLHQGSLHFGGPLPIDRNTLAHALLRAIKQTMNVRFQLFTPSADFLGNLLDLIFQKYANPQWNAKR